MSPRRVQLRRAKGWHLPEGAVVVARPTRWGNPFRVHDFGRQGAVALYRSWLEGRLDLARCEQVEAVGEPLSIGKIRDELAGKVLACWCPLIDGAGLPVPCHADVLLELANT